MYRLLVLALLLAACDASLPEPPADASALVGTWGLASFENAVDVTSPTDQTLTDYATVTDEHVAVTGLDVPPLTAQRTWGTGADVSVAFQSEEGFGRSAELILAVTELEVTVSLTTYDPALEASGDAIRSYRTQRPASAVTRDGGRLTLAPVELAGDDGSAVIVEAAVAFDTQRVRAGETARFVRVACDGRGTRGNRALLYQFETGGTYTSKRLGEGGLYGIWGCGGVPDGTLTTATGTWTYEGGELRLDGGRAVRVRVGGGRLYFDDVQRSCTSGACFRSGEWPFAWSDTPTSIVWRYTNVFRDDG